MAWPRDVVGEQAQTAPLLGRLTSSPIGKRPLALENDEVQLKKKKRESLLNVPFSGEETGGFSRLTDAKMSEAGQGKTERQSFTVCYLCDLHFLTELELEEHLYSLLHHRALETEKGKDFTHECNLCCARSNGLSEYVLHLRSDQHKDKVETRKKDIENNKNPGPVYALYRYKETFIHPPKKQAKTAPPAKILQAENRKKFPKSKSSSVSELRRGVNVEKGQLYRNRMRGVDDRRSPHRENRSVAKPPLLAPPSKWQRPPDLYPGFHYPPNGFRPPYQMGYSHYDPYGRWTPRNYRENRFYYDDDYGRNSDEFYMPQYGKETDVFKKPISYQDEKDGRNYLSDREKSPANGRSPHSKDLSKSLSKDGNAMRKWKKKLKLHKPQMEERKSPLSSNGMTPRRTLKMGDLCKSDGSFNSASNSSTPSSSSSKKKKKNNKSAKLLANKLRQTSIKNQRNFNNRKAHQPISSSSVSTLKSTSVDNSAMRGSTSSSFAPLVGPRRNSGYSRPTAHNTDPLSKDLDTNELRDKFRMVMDSLEQPSSHRSAASSRTDLHSDSQKPVMTKMASTSEPSVGETSSNRTEDLIVTKAAPSSVESPSIIRNKLLELAKSKERQQAELRSESSDSHTISSCPTDELSRDKTSNEDSGDPKKKDFPKPNLSKARSRLTSKPSQSLDGSSELDKHTRLATLMLKTRNKAHTTSPKKTSNVDQSGPRFGIGMMTREPEKLDLDESDYLDILQSINDVEADVDAPAPTNPLKNQESKKENGNTSPSNPPLSEPPAPAPSNLTSNTPDPVNTPQPMHIKTEVVPAKASKPAALLRHSNCTPAVGKTPTPVSRVPPTPEVAPSKQPGDDLSLKLLHMSEREELLHEQDQVVKEKSAKLSDEMAHVNSLIEQLVDRKKDLEEAMMRVKEEETVIRRDLEMIRLNRLAMLRRESAKMDPASRLSASASSGGSNDGDTPAPSSGRMGRPNSCSHSTPTPGSHHNVTPFTPTTANPNFPDSQSTISNLPTPDQSKYESAIGIQISLPLKNENPPVPSLPEDPFPVPSGSIYFDAGAPSTETKMTSPSVDKILGKYLKEASNERGVVSSTTPPKPQLNHLPARSRIQPADTEVSSTTCHREVTNRGDSLAKDPKMIPMSLVEKNVTRKKKIAPSDPHLAKLALEQPSSKEVTSSWVTAHNPLCDYNTSILTSENATPTTLTAEQNEVASLRAMTLEHHSASVLCVHVTECGKILTCSKDKTLCVTDVESGQLLKRYNLPGIPFRTCIVFKKGSGTLTLFVVFVDESNEKGMLAESSLHSVKVKLRHNNSDVEKSEPRMKKLLHHHNCIMCVHHYDNLLYLGARDGKVSIFCTDTNLVREVLDCHSPHAVCCLTTGTDGGRAVLCCGSSDCRISVRDANDGLLLKTLLGHNKTVNCMQDGDSWFYSFCDIINFFNYYIKKLIMMQKQESKTAGLQLTKIEYVGRLHLNLLYSGSSNRSVLVHNIQSGDIIHRFLGMHSGSIKSLSLHRNAIVTLCLDKSVRVLRTEPCRITGSPKPLATLPLSMHVRFEQLAGSWEGYHVILAYAYVGCQDGKVQVIPLNQLAYKVPKQQNLSLPNICVKEEIPSQFDNPMDVGVNLQCLWNGCGADGFTNSSSLLTHIGLFHATDSYKDKLDSCCLWASCTHYFSSDLDTALDVHLHMDRHVSDAVQFSRRS